MNVKWIKEYVMSSRKAQVCLLLLVTLLLLRESGVLSLNWYDMHRKSTVSSSMLDLRQFKSTTEIVCVNGYGESTTFKIRDSPGRYTIRLTVQDRFSDWPVWHTLPLFKFGSSEHRIYYKVETQRGDETAWNVWGIIPGKSASVSAVVTGLCSSYEYRRSIINELVGFKQSDFDFMLKESVSDKEKVPLVQSR